MHHQSMLSGAQTWTIIVGVFSVLSIVLGIAMTAFTNSQRSLKAELLSGLSTLRAEMGDEFALVRSEAQSFRTETLLRFDNVDQRFDSVDGRLNALDRDMQAVTQRVFRGPETG